MFLIALRACLDVWDWPITLSYLPSRDLLFRDMQKRNWGWISKYLPFLFWNKIACWNEEKVSEIYQELCYQGMDTTAEHLFCVLQSLGWHEMVDPRKGQLFRAKLFKNIGGCFEGAISLHLSGI